MSVQLSASEANDRLWERCDAKLHKLASVGEGAGQGGSGMLPVDLVVLSDTSASMEDEVSKAGEVVAKAIESARSTCTSDLRVQWLGIEGHWSQIHVEHTVRDYLHGLGFPKG